MISASNVLCFFQSCLIICHHELTAVNLLNFLKQITDQTACLTMNTYLQLCMQWVSLQRKQLRDLCQEKWSLSWLDAHLKLYLMSCWLQLQWSHSLSYCDLAHKVISVLSWAFFFWRSAMSSSIMMCWESMSSQVIQYFFSNLWSSVWKHYSDMFRLLRFSWVVMIFLSSLIRWVQISLINLLDDILYTVKSARYCLPAVDSLCSYLILSKCHISLAVTLFTISFWSFTLIHVLIQ